MPTDKQAKFIKHLLGRRSYYSEDWGWLGGYSIKQAGKLIDKLLKPEQWGEWCADFISKLPEPKEKPRKQAWLPLPDPEPMPMPLPSDLPPEVAEFKRWARDVFQRGELTMTQLCELYDARFGKLTV